MTLNMRIYTRSRHAHACMRAFDTGVLLVERCGDEVVCCVEADRVFVGRFDKRKPRRDRLAQRGK